MQTCFGMHVFFSKLLGKMNVLCVIISYYQLSLLIFTGVSEGSRILIGYK